MLLWKMDMGLIRLVKRSLLNKTLSMLILLGYMGLILILSLIPDTHELSGFLALVSKEAQNLLHIPAYGILAVLWMRAIMAYGLTELRSIFVAFVIASGYGALMELAQAWIPGRFPSISDLIFDITGILLFIWLYRQIKFRVPGLKFRVKGVKASSKLDS